MAKKPLKSLPYLFVLLFLPLGLHAAGDNTLIHHMLLLVFQLTIILFAAKYMGKLFRYLRLPGVIGELFAGVLIGPYLLGGIGLPGFPNGLFGHYLHLNPGAALPISPELYGFSVVASILLLFMVGLETDIDLFLRFTLPSIVIGGLGVAASFATGAGLGSVFLQTSFMNPQALFLGVISTATSVGITARILSSRKKINSPEGVTILGSAVIDDVLGIILLAVVIGIATAQQGAFEWSQVGMVALKALAVWLVFTALGLIFARYISRFLKTFKKQSTVGIMSFGLAMLLAGIFESAGLAMIIGAYVMGLSLSKTDLSYVIQESLNNIYEFFIPIFFCVSGMFVNVRVFDSWHVVLFGLVYTVGAYVSKMLGCGLPAFFFKFNRTGALRIGTGMTPRGEVALIIIGIGLSYGVFTEETTGVAILMILVTSLLSPVQLDRLMRKKRSGVRESVQIDEHIQTDYSFPSVEICEMVSSRLVRYFREEGFYINLIEGDEHLYHIRRHDTFLSFHFAEKTISFFSKKGDIPYVKNIMYETLLELHQTIEKLKALAKPRELKKDLETREPGTEEKKNKMRLSLEKILHPDSIIMHLDAEKKEDIIRALVDKLDDIQMLTDRDEALKAILEREKAMSTGMQFGVALPHGKTDAVRRMTMAVGLKPGGVDFQSLDGKPSKVFVLVVSRKQAAEPHIQLLSEIGKKLHSEEAVDKLLKCKNKEEVRNFFIT